MYDLVVITDPETSIGFRLAGVETFPAEDDSAAGRHLQNCLQNKDIGIIALSEDFAPSLDHKLTQRLEESIYPTLILIPSGNRLRAGLAQERMLRGLIKNAIGFDLRLPSE